jgi:hypothetical protein
MFTEELLCQVCGAMKPVGELKLQKANGRAKMIHKCRQCRGSGTGIHYDAFTEVDYQRLHKAQGGVCAICNFIPLRRPLVVDHDHTTGEVRGLLCSQCNLGLGLFRDEPDYLTQAKEYLLRHLS